MPNAWFRMYAEFADDPKVQMMSEAMQRRLTMLFCLRCLGKPIETFRETEIAFKWRISMQDLAETKALFLENGFIDEKWNVLNWNKRQYVSDSSTERVRQYRERLKQDETLQETEQAVTVTTPEQIQIQIQSRTDAEQKEPELTLLSPTAPEEKIRPEEFANIWNRLRGKFPKVDKFTDGRRKKIQARIRQGMTLERFMEAIENCHKKPFLRGENDRGWIATFDWLIANEENAEKAITNPYGLNKPNGNGGNHANLSKQGMGALVGVSAESIARGEYQGGSYPHGGVQTSENEPRGLEIGFGDVHEPPEEPRPQSLSSGDGDFIGEHKRSGGDGATLPW